jgi:inosine/xanthosine triphosphate pyrophosphatase family protein
MKLIYATGNAIKFRQAHDACTTYGIQLDQTFLDIPEIQDDDGLVIAKDKAEKVFAELQQPVIISDDSWIVPGLQGFPGAYMKSVDHWLNEEDWLRLTLPLKDRRIILRQIVVYQDSEAQQTFTYDIEGLLLTEIRGKSPFPHSCITSFDGGKTSVGEFHERNEPAAQSLRHVWHDFAEWYSEKHEQ